MGRTLATPDSVSLLSPVLPITMGGTGASTVEAAISNLNVVKSAEVLDGSGNVKPELFAAGTVNSVNVSGPTFVITSQSAVFTVTNNDIGTTYTLSAVGGSVTKAGAVVTFTAGGTANVGGGFTINGKFVSCPVLTPFVNQTSITSPTSGATGQGGTVTVTSSAFAVNGASDTHAASDWQIATDAAFTNIVASVTASATNLTSWTASGLTANTTYYVRCRHKGTALGYGAWSATVSFITKSSFLFVAQQAQITASDKANSDRYGHALALSSDGNTCAVGANAATRSSLSSCGAAYIFTRSGTTWTQQAQLLASDKATNDLFGQSIALSSDGNTCAVGAYNATRASITQCGTAYIFTRSGSTWSQQAQLLASDKATSDYFGTSIALSSDGNTCAIGCYQTDSGGVNNAGAGYIFTRSGVTWTQQAKLTASDKAGSDMLGYSIALNNNGTVCALGSRASTRSSLVQCGAVYIFIYNNTAWVQEAQLVANNIAGGDNFGYSVALSSDGNTCAVGAIMTTRFSIAQCGSVYIFTRSGSTWTQQAELLANDKANYDRLGSSVSLSSDGNTCVAGAYYATRASVSSCGAVYVFTRSGTTWTQQTQMSVTVKAADDYFGWSIALSADGLTCVVGSPCVELSGLADTGTAYIFN